jgi:hypothetical protein
VRADRFKHFAAIDWSGAKGARQKGIAIAVADAAGGAPVLAEPDRAWSRADVLTILRDLPDDTLVGMDLGISLPFADCGAFFPGWEASPHDAKALWALVDDICAEDPNLEVGSFVAHPVLREYFHHGDHMGDRYRCDGAGHRNGRLRVTEHAQARMGCRPHSNLKLVGSGQVGKSSLTGMRVLHRLDGKVPVWPYDPVPERGSVIVEMYTAIPALAAGRTAATSKLRDYDALNSALAHPAVESPPVRGIGALSDDDADALLTAAWLRRAARDPARWSPNGLTPALARTEGWTFGAV